MEIIDGPTIAQLANKLRIPRRTMFRRLLSMHGADRTAAGVTFIPWLYRFQGGPWKVNMSRLRRAHPEMFAVATNEELEREQNKMRRDIEVLKSGLRAVVARVKATAPICSPT